MQYDKMCVLCGKDRTQVKRLILGIHGGVCPECVYRCLHILQDTAKTETAEVSADEHNAHPAQPATK